ncbi:DUF1835 domain-containing protein [Aquipseudomonas campi]
MWHLVCGDAAVEGVSFVLGEAVATSCLRVLRDDLAVGPLGDVEQPHCPRRAAFWQAVWPQAVQPVPDFAQELDADAHWLASLAQHAEPVTLWHGDSASEQLLLARVAAALQLSDVPLWEVACGSGDSRVATRRAVSMHAPEAVRALYQPKRVDAQRQQHLASQWQSALRDDASIRRWRDGAFHGEDYTAIDTQLLASSSPEWQPLARVMASVMARCDGFFATDFFLFWRARELAAAGQLQLDGQPDQSGYGGLLARRQQP